MEAKGQKLLKVCGVLFIIQGIVGVLSYGLLTLMLGAETVIEKATEGVPVVGIAVFYLIAAIVALIAGVMGVKKCTDKSAAGACLGWGILNLVLTFIAGVWSYMGEGCTVAHFIYTAIALVLPSLYVAGAYINKD